ncbi:unnamed protein product [Alternaria alternata]
MAKKCKCATKAASVAAPRPVTSPYTSPSATLYFGSTLQEYHLPDVLLQRLERIPSHDSWTGKIHLADVHASIGHVLIHFLHTGLYQTLSKEEPESTENTQQDNVNEFQTALLTLEAAKKYGVPGLQDLAQVELERRGEDMCLRDAVRVIREDFLVGPSGEHAWLRDYVSTKVRSAFEHDPSAILAPDFFDSIGSPTLTKLVAQIIVGLYSEELDKLRKEKTATGRISAPGHSELPRPCSPDIADLPSKQTSEGFNGWPTCVQNFGAFDDSSAAWGPHNLPGDVSSSKEADAPAVLLSSIEEDSHATERGDAKSWGLDKDKIETQHFRAEEATIAQSQEEDAAENSTMTKDQEDGAGVEPLWGTWMSLAKKEKKFKVKTGSSTPLVPPPDPQLEVDPTLVIPDVETVGPVVSAEQGHQETEKDPYAGLSKLKAKRLKAKLDKEARLKEKEDARRQKEEEETAEIRRQEEAEAELIRLEEEEAESRRLKEEEYAVAAAEAEKFKKREEEEADPWATFPAAPLKKARKNNKINQTEQMGLEDQEANTKKIEGEDVAAADIRAEICPTKDDNPWDDWGPAAPIIRKKKKSKKPNDLTLAEDEENERILREKENAAVAATIADLSVVGSTSATFDDADCKLRVEHLSQNYGWQNCRLCELYVRKIAMKHHSEGLPIDDGFSTIN